LSEARHGEWYVMSEFRCAKNSGGWCARGASGFKRSFMSGLAGSTRN
jgi:hypothetical protein